MKSLSQKITNSALWSAYGDSIGFITELADEKVLTQRANCKYVQGLIPWTRKIGGFSGTSVNLPAGIYSDDTQLRLSTSRCINSNGYFDVESFAKIELPIWLSYCLGAGRGTKLAAKNLIKSDTSWFSNFYEEKNGNYFHSGGNGALMRIQPHVWASVNDSKNRVILDVVKNTICTHGHPRAIIGACFHALLLKETLSQEKIPKIEEWFKLSKDLADIENILSNDIQISTFWVPAWENSLNNNLKRSLTNTINEINSDIEILIGIDSKSTDATSKYVEALNILGGFDPAQRGSGTKTAVLSAFLSYLFESSPEEGMLLSANQLGSDTDTIATAAGAIIGAISNITPRDKILDQKYIEKEAIRISELNDGSSDYEFTHPDLLSWRAPRKLADSLYSSQGDIYISGLGKARHFGKQDEEGKNKSIRWSWVQSAFGQTFLIRSRDEFIKLEEPWPSGYTKSSKVKQTPIYEENAEHTNKEATRSNKKTHTHNYFIPPYLKNKQNNKTTSDIGSIDDLISSIKKSGFNQSDIGISLLKLIDDGRPTEEIVAFTAALTIIRRQTP